MTLLQLDLDKSVFKLTRFQLDCIVLHTDSNQTRHILIGIMSNLVTTRRLTTSLSGRTVRVDFSRRRVSGLIACRVFLDILKILFHGSSH